MDAPLLSLEEGLALEEAGDNGNSAHAMQGFDASAFSHQRWRSTLVPKSIATDLRGVRRVESAVFIKVLRLERVALIERAMGWEYKKPPIRQVS